MNIMFHVYKVLNNVNRKIYVGKTSNIEGRWFVHINESKNKCFYPLHKAIKKYGENNFTISIVESYDLEEDALKREIFWIEEYKTNICKYGNEYGYNLTAGGEGISGYSHTEETKNKISKSLTGIKRFFTKEHGRKISKTLTGRTISEETRIKLLARPKRSFNDETKLKISNSNRRYNDEQELEMLKLRDSGFKISEIAERYECSTRTIFNIFARRRC